MNEITALPAPELASTTESTSKWENEYRTYLRLRSELLGKHRGEYVAVHNGQAVDSGDDQLAVALRCYQRFGYVPIYVGLVSDEPQAIGRIPSPRIIPRLAE